MLVSRELVPSFMGGLADDPRSELVRNGGGRNGIAAMQELGLITLSSLPKRRMGLKARPLSGGDASGGSEPLQEELPRSASPVDWEAWPLVVGCCSLLVPTEAIAAVTEAGDP